LWFSNSIPLINVLMITRIDIYVKLEYVSTSVRLYCMKYFEQLEMTGKFARTGVLHTRVGDVFTPTFMPDGTRGAVKGLTPEQVADTGVQVVLANTYHLHLAPGESVIKSLGGLHKFANRPGPMLTDSGGFQVFSLGAHTKITEEGVEFRDPKTGDKHFISPEESIRIQLDLGAFDHLVGLGGESAADVRDAFDRTHRWLARCTAEFGRLTSGITPKDRPILFGVVQGGLDLDLRRQSLEMIQGSDVGAVAIGGLSVGETRTEMAEVLEHLAPHFDPDRARFLLGVGTPEDLHIAIENGIDMLDCVLPTRNARHATVWTTGSEKIHLTNERFSLDSSVIEPGCDCYACTKGFSKAFLRHQFKSAEPLAGTLASIHNLRHMTRICEKFNGIDRQK
jgi:queuine tRNA-ribosyltransferase